MFGSCEALGRALPCRASTNTCPTPMTYMPISLRAPLMNPGSPLQEEEEDESGQLVVHQDFALTWVQTP